MANPPVPFVSSHSRREDRAWSRQTPRPTVKGGNGLASIEGSTREGKTRMSLSALLEQLRHQARPSGLVVGADARPVVAVEVLVEEEVVAEVWVALQLLRLPERRTASVFIAQEDRGESSGDLRRDLGERELPAGAGGKLHREALAQVMVELLQRLDQEVVDREPDRPPPVGVAAEQPARRLRRLVADPIFGAVDLQHVGLVAVHAGERADAIRREELSLVQQAAQDPAQLVRIDD